MKKSLILFTTLFLFLISLVACKSGDPKPEKEKKASGKSGKVKVSYYLSEPYTEEYTDYPSSLVLNFNGSAARIDEVGKAPSGQISLDPPIAGEWRWASDTELVFEPSENWKLNTKYKINYTAQVFADNINVSGDQTFITEKLTASLYDAEFYVDPIDPNNKRVTCTLYTSHPMKKEDVDKAFSMTLTIGEGKKAVTQNYSYTTKFNKEGTRAYLVSENIPMPPKTSSMEIKLKSNAAIHAANQDTTASFNYDSRYVEIPGMSDYVRINDISHTLVKNDSNNYDQVLHISTKGQISSEELAKHLQIYLLPKDRPAEQGWRAATDYSWYSTDEVTDLVLSKSSKIDFEIIPTEENVSTLNSFKFKAPAGKALYVKLTGNILFHGGYKLTEDTETVIYSKRYPKELGILSEGTILSLSGSKKMAMYSRGVKTVYYSLSRIMPKDVNHLVSMSNGNMQNFSFDSYRFSEKNIAETKYYEQDIVDYSDETISYFAFDFSDDLKNIPSKNLSNGLFIFKVSNSNSNESYYYDDDGLSDKRLILITDLGFFVKRNADNTKDVFVQSLSTGKPVANAEVSIVGLNGNAIASTKTDSNGHARLPETSYGTYSNEHRPTAFVVKTANDLSFMPYEGNGRYLDYSNYDVGGVYGKSDSQALTGYIFSDRGMYRPGDTVNLGLIVKAGDWNISLSNITLECNVTDSNSSTVYSQQFQLDSSGFAEINFATQDYSPTGVYNIEISRVIQNDNYTRKSYLTGTTVKVEEFLPDTLKITTGFDPLPNTGWLNPGDLKGTVSLKNLFGTPASGNEVKAQLTLTPGFPSLRRYSDYYFSDPLYKGNSFEEFLGTKETDENGETSFILNTEKFEKATYRLDFYAEGYVKGGGRSVSQVARTYVSPLKYLIGYKTDGKLSYINRNSVRKINLIAIDQNLEKTSVNDITIAIEEVKYVSTLVKQYDGLYKYQSVKKTYPVSSKSYTIPKEGLDFTLPTTNGGEYKVTITDNSGLVFNTISYSVMGTENVTRSLTRTAELELSLESSDLKAGQKAKVFIKAPYAGAGLITVERDKVYTSKWFKTDSLSTEQTIDIPADMEGNGYINVMFTRDAASEEIFMSPFCYGAIPFSIDKDNRTNKITLNVPEEIKSGSDLTIEYSSSDSGKIIIYAVDEGILQVAGYSMPNPLAEFFKKRALEVSTTQILDLVLPEYEVLKNMSAIGGGAGMDELARNLNPFKRKQNKPVAYWSGILDTDSTTRSVTYHVPDYFNGNLKIMAVAVSSRTLGTAQNSTIATNTFIISPNTPLAAAPGDEFDVSVTVTNNHKGSGNNAKVTLKASTSSNLEISGDKSVPLSISEGKDATVMFKVKAKDGLGNADLIFTASDATEESKYVTTMSIRPSMPYQTWIRSGSTTKKEASIDVQKNLYDEYSEREVTVANVPASFENGLKKYLAEYPYGCSEQITSKAYPYLYSDFVTANGKTRADAISMVASTLSILQSRMKSDGNIGYWTNKSPDDPFITLYVAEFLTDARTNGFFVSSDFFNKVMGAVKSIANSSEDDGYSIYLRSFAIYVLTKGEIVTTSYIEKLEDSITRKNFNTTGFDGLYLAASYAMMKEDKKANAILAKIDRKKDHDSSWAYQNDLQYIATYIDVIASYFPSRIKDITTDDIELLCSRLENKYYNSYSTSAAIRAFESWTGSASTENYTAYEVSGKTETKLDISGKPVMTASFSDKAEKIKFVSSKTMPMYYQTYIAGFDKELPKKDVKNGIEVSREFCNLEGGALGSVKVGDDIMVKVSFRSLKGTVRNVALVDLQVAGLEADIESVRSFKDNRWSPDYVDIREDRVVIYATATEKVQTFTYTAKATNSGTFVVPPMFGESMYNKDIYGMSASSTLKIEAQKK